jgi:DivIVA domain-containing protein
MNNEKLFLTPQEIYNKEFKIDAEGYRPKEVDQFLDMVIRDYSEFTNIIKKLQIENRELSSDNAKLKTECRRLRAIIDTAQDGGGTSKPNFNNVDLLKRISNLEKAVYGKSE